MYVQGYPLWHGLRRIKQDGNDLNVHPQGTREYIIFIHKMDFVVRLDMC